MFRFKNFRVYKEAKEYCKYCENVLSKINRPQIYALSGQIRSAYLSIVLNIAEGSACDSDKEFRRFLEISLRSIHETVAAFDIAFELGFVNDKIQLEIEKKAEDLSKQLNSFRKILDRK